MVDLIARSPCAGLLPAEIGGTRLTEVMPGAITLVAPFKGRKSAVSAALKAAVGAPFPAPNRSGGSGDARIVWTGPGQALVIGPAVAPEGAAVTDLSDGFAVLHLEGPLAGAALARLCPLDLRADRFRRGHTARTLLRHIACSITRLGAARFELLIPRSMAKTAVDDLTGALARLEGLAKLG